MKTYENYIGKDCIYFLPSERFSKKLNGNYNYDGHRRWVQIALMQAFYYFGCLHLKKDDFAQEHDYRRIFLGQIK